MDPRVKKCVCLGFSKGVKGYKIRRPEAKKITVNIDVTFDESSIVK